MLKKFLQSGILERYCASEATVEERLQIDIMAYNYPEIEAELLLIKNIFANNNNEEELPKISKVKYRLMQEVYKDCATTDPRFLPLFGKSFSTDLLNRFLRVNNINTTPAFDDNLHAIPLESTIEVQNAAVWVKSIFEEEVHTDHEEYIYVVQGSCVMKLDEASFNYSDGDIIFIPPFVKHSAIITSEKPMFALVQRQLLAN